MMKRLFIFMITLCLIVCAGVAGAELKGAERKYVEDLDDTAYVWWNEEYEFVPYDDGTAIVVGYRGYIEEEEEVSLTVPEELEGYRVTDIGKRAFEGCNAKEIVLPQGVERIGEYAFHGTMAVRVHLPESVRIIEDCAFYRSVDLEQVNIPGRVTYIGSQAFAYTSLREITLPETELVLNGNPFASNELLTKINFSENHPTLMKYGSNQILSRSDNHLIGMISMPGEELYQAEFSPDTHTIGDDAFMGFVNMREITIPGTIKHIGAYAFFETNLERVIIEEGVETIGESAFCYGRFLKSVTIPSSVTHIDEYVFDECDSVILKVEAGSYAETYAKENNIRYINGTYDEHDLEKICGIGVDFYKGRGVKQDYEEAFNYFMIAAEQGYAYAQHYLGWMYERGEGVEADLGKAIEWVRLAAEQNVSDSQYNLAILYTRNGAYQDIEEAFKWHKRAAEQKHASAQYYLGLFYDRGLGTEQDIQEAVKWYKEAANNGSAGGKWMLGKCYYDGRGVPVDHDLAEKWITSAAEQGQKDALAFLENNNFKK